MKLSKKTEYAFRALLELSLHGSSNGALSAAEIAKNQDIPIKFLEQILVILKGGGLVSSRRGQKGGYYINRSPNEVSLAEVIRLFEGEITLIRKNENGNGASNGNGISKDQLNGQAIAEVLEQLSSHLSSKLETVTFKEISEREKELSKASAPEYCI